eukprot:8223249-Pyramimonas_sp.AAC.1
MLVFRAAGGGAEWEHVRHGGGQRSPQNIHSGKGAGAGVGGAGWKEKKGKKVVRDEVRLCCEHVRLCASGKKGIHVDGTGVGVD